MKNWKKIEYVVLKDAYHGDNDGKCYDSLCDFVSSNDFRAIRGKLVEHKPYVAILNYVVYADNRRYQLVDECGIPVPLWKIQEAIDGLPYPPTYQQRNAKNSKHRVDPIPYTGVRNWSFKHCYKYPHTKQERSVLVGMRYDEDMIEYNIKSRGRRCMLPSAWDDSLRGDYKNRRNWKSTRAHQYKIS